MLRRVVLPASVAINFHGLRVGLGIGWTAVIVSEMVAVKSGAGLRPLGCLLRRTHGRGDCRYGVDWRPRFPQRRMILMLERWVLTWRRLQSFQT